MKRRPKLTLDIAKIRQLREEIGMTYQVAADRAGFRHRNQWHLIESGKHPDVRLSTLEKIAMALRVAPAELLKK